jgi:hypothetical protein
MNTLMLFLNFFVLRAKPQDLPASTALLAAAAAVCMIADFLSLPDKESLFGPALFVGTRPVLYGAACWFLLKQRGFEARWVQTATALFAAIAMLSLLRLPLLPALLEMMKQAPVEGQPIALGWQAFASFALELWFLVLVARILREALELRPWVSALVCIGVVFSIEITRFVLAPSFGLTGPL